jgi:hypothetical protein
MEQAKRLEELLEEDELLKWQVAEFAALGYRPPHRKGSRQSNRSIEPRRPSAFPKSPHISGDNYRQMFSEAIH